ncbi:beta/alpha barrel domain-containing protein [Sphingobacterium rhinopitheci]|uniref:hydroxymethylglutaryl-CoA lyase n=1 Tax=Sphingobacterium rhinopitheci TaxID=2781960 RepID=UPI001F5281C5|nr:hydroxymethylglutaryl-CoA lyase [Sphingobacterium rhinopitheci]MCI0921886.1 hydroxymethylglutaryl-CoA lyase [Sphingobacterium rhinopitheci]
MYINTINLVECPRDAMQGITHFIPTERKIEYLNELIASNIFEYIDFGSFVSPKIVPQMKDTLAVLEGLRKINETKLLAIVANERGAEIAVNYNKIDYLGYPFSISETFQQRNTNSSIAKSFSRIENIVTIVANSGQEIVIYISMAFGNPYGDHWRMENVIEWIDRISHLGIKRFSIADTTSEASPSSISDLFIILNRRFPTLDFGIHLHSRIESSLLKIEAAYQAGCSRFEGAFLGYGGCPFAQDDLVGNVPMELLLDRFNKSDSLEMTKLMISFQNMILHDNV